MKGVIMSKVYTRSNGQAAFEVTVLFPQRLNYDMQGLDVQLAELFQADGTVAIVPTPSVFKAAEEVSDED